MKKKLTSTYPTDRDSQRRLLFQTAMAIAIPTMAFAVQRTFWVDVRPNTWLVFYPAVLLVAIIGGTFAGLLATTIATTLGVIYFLPDSNEFILLQPNHLISIAVFLMMSITISILSGQKHSAASSTSNLMKMLSSTNKQLQRVNTELFEKKIVFQQNEDRIKIATSGTEIGVWEWDVLNDQVYCSESFNRQLGYDNQTVPATRETIHKLLDPDSSDRTIKEFESFLKSSDVQYESQIRLQHKDQNYRWFLVRGLLQRDSGGMPLRMTGIRLDITKQKSAEEMFGGLLESAPDPMVACNSTGDFIFVNKQFETQFGFDRNELSKMTLEAILPARFQARHVDLRQTYFENPSPRPMGGGRELIARRKDGSEFPVEVSLGPFKTNNGYLVTAAIRDITERKKINHQLKMAKDAADRANSAKSIFLANMSHEIRTPLAVMIGYAELLGSNLNPDENNAYATSIIHNGRLLLDLINDILDLSKVEADKIELSPRPLELSRFLDDVLKHLRVKSDEKGLKLNLTYIGDVPKTIVIDDVRLRQILMNVIGNAIKFTKQGEINVLVGLKLSGETALLEIDVHDTGPGIPADAQSRIFEPFTQASNSTYRNFGGTGLGLSLSRKLAKLMGGALDLKASILGQGSTFTITVSPGNIENVPLIKNEDLENTEKQSLDLSLSGRLSGIRILVVEDAPELQILMRKMLEIAGAIIDVASNGKEALEKIKTSKFEIILMDIQMPVMNGYETIKRMRASGYDGSVIALTASAMKEDVDSCLKGGFTGYLSKPISYDVLIQAILQYSQRSQPAFASTPSSRPSVNLKVQM